MSMKNVVNVNAFSKHKNKGNALITIFLNMIVLTKFGAKTQFLWRKNQNLIQSDSFKLCLD